MYRFVPTDPINYYPNYHDGSRPSMVSASTDYALDLSTKRKTVEPPNSLISPTHSVPSAYRGDIIPHMPTAHCPTPSPQNTISSCVTSETSEPPMHSDISESDSGKRKAVRPFKAVAKDSIALSVDAIQHLNTSYLGSPLYAEVKTLDAEQTRHFMEESAKRYGEYREQVLAQLHNNGNKSTNQNMRRSQNNLEKAQDPEYLEKRKKNNEAAKKSRDARRQKVDELAIRVSFLERENIMLKCKLQSEMEEVEGLRKLLLSNYNSCGTHTGIRCD